MKIIHGDCLKVLKKIPDNKVDLIIADPPYFKVVSEKWDYEWRTLDDYIQWCIEWLKECHRVLRLGGTLYIFGYIRVLGHLFQHFKKLGFDYRQTITIDKGMQSVSGRSTKNYKIFPNTTEHLIMLIKDNKQWVKKFLKKKQKEKEWSAKKINENLGMKSNGGGMWSLYTANNVCEQFPTRENWKKLSNLFGFNIPYEKVAQTYNAQMGLTNVWNDINFYFEDHQHSTQKPLKLMERIIKASSNEGDLIVDIFMGSGSSGVIAKLRNRRFIGIEINKDFVKIARKRILKKRLM